MIMHEPVLYAPAGLPKEKPPVAAGAPAVVAPELAVAPAPPKSEGFAAPPASPAGLNEKGLDAGCDAPAVACVFPKSGLDAAGVVDAPPNSVLPPVPAAPKRDGAAAGVLVPADVVLFAPPKRLDVPELAAPPPNSDLFGVLLLLLLLKLKAIVV
jgi:hypothetical protein